MALMAILLVTQFNSYYQALLILSSVLLSTAGVLLGLLITGQTFSIILDRHRHRRPGRNYCEQQYRSDRHLQSSEGTTQGLVAQDIIVHTGVQRLRPVFLTTFTTGFGLLPLAMHVSVDLIGAEIEVGGPITSQWVSLASAIVFGLSFGTILTLVVTPAMLALPDRLRSLLGKLPRYHESPSLA